MKPAEYERLWAAVEPLLPKERPKPKGGRPRVSDKQVLRGILFILDTGIPWARLPKEMGYGSGMTCWRGLRQWQAQGVWDTLHGTLLERLHVTDSFDWQRFSIDSGVVPSPRGAKRRVRTRPTEASRGTKRHVVVNGHGVPLVCLLSGAHRHDCKLFAPAMDALPRIKGKRGRPRKRPRKVHADKGYDYPMCRRYLQRHGIASRIARKCVESKDRLGRHRWIIERSLFWLNRFRKLRICYERCADAYLALCKFACCLITLRFVDRFC